MCCARSQHLDLVLYPSFERIMSTSDSNSHEHPSEIEEDLNEGDTGDSENGDEGEKKTAGGNASRVVTLQSLLGAGILEPGEGAMTIDYLGQKFTGDLLLDGKIKSQETEKIYASPTAWAQSCKKIVNPEKQSGCGWATVRYKGRKLDSYKSFWLKKQYEESCLANDFMEAFSKNLIQHERELAEEDAVSTGTPPPLTLEDPQDPELSDRKQRPIIRHGVLGNRQTSHDPNLLVESVTFSSLGKIQPFLITLTSNAALIIDFHCHLTTSEVVGYLAGTWDVNSHVVTVSHAFPLRCRLGDFDRAPAMESDTLQIVRSRGLTLLGWYHSHPRDPAQPTLRDIDTQLDYELKMKGNTDSAYIPCVGLICSPYNMFNASMESEMVFYWVAPPPESRIYEYGKPMTMNYTLVQDESMPHDVLLELNRCADFYKNDRDYVVFDNVYKKGVTYLEKLKISTARKYPRNQENAELLWKCLQGIATSLGEKPERQLLDDMIAIANMPCVSPPEEKPKLNIPNIMPATSPLSGSSTPPPPPRPRRRRSSKETAKPAPSLSNYFGSDLANALFASANPFMGLDPTALSLLNLNSLALSGMFLPPMPPFKPDPGLGLMKPPPPPSPYNPYTSSRSSRSRSSSNSPSSSHRNSPSATSTRDMPPPNKVPKIENNGNPPSLGKNCTITSGPTSTSSK